MTDTARRQATGSTDPNMQNLGLRPEERWPFYADDEIDAVASVLRSGKVNQWTGPEVDRFAAACTDRFGGGHGIALANGSVALELALRAFGIGPGDEVIVSPRSFVASASCVLLVGATPVFADVDPDSGNISPPAIERAITDKTRAIIPVHLAGWPADMPAIMDIAARRGIKVIEDCAQAHGARIAGRSVGSFGDSAAYSFCQDKIITTGGEGGFVSFRDRDAYDWAWSFKDHGKVRAKTDAAPGQPGEFRFVHDQVGTNWRLTGPQAAIGLRQLDKLDDWVAARTRNAQIWIDALGGVPGLRVPTPPSGTDHAYYKLYAYLDVPGGNPAAIRSEIIRRAAADGLRIFSGSCPEIYREQPFTGLPHPDCPVAHALGETSLLVEVHPTLDPVLLKLRAQRLAEIARDTIAVAGEAGA